MAPKSQSSPSTSYSSITDEINHITSLNEFQPITIRINPRNHKFVRIVLWTKSAFDIEKLEIPPVVPDVPPFGIHGFNPVNVRQGSNNHIISDGHRCRRDKFDITRFRTNVIKRGLHRKVNIYWPTLERGCSQDGFLKRQAWKYNTDRRLFPEYRDFIAKGLDVGSHYIELLCASMSADNYNFDNVTHHTCQGIKNWFNCCLSVKPDCRFYQLPHRPGVFGLRKIGILGVVTVLPDQARQFNPVNFELNPNNLRKDENFNIDNSVFVLETLSTSCGSRAHLIMNPPVQTHKRKPDEGEGSSARNKERLKRTRR